MNTNFARIRTQGPESLRLAHLCGEADLNTECQEV
jgi:hypothetical protein